ncbi:SIMPL domain-containing protein [Sphaerisporangium sp. TRM90804]|uniref:SIMPL domain-containing protein n=1 Tax=Sphaerisporangium sp. TRM90804 TaxID=3031113 RepID=UPI0024475938|nr:SIMPL domain-containing protein [Sphaerisporangium sp. TRM90804]MDH2424579.1 SIMPL domain-containing protein [Sphaerisporangium sp. TRM90804]
MTKLSAAATAAVFVLAGLQAGPALADPAPPPAPAATAAPRPAAGEGGELAVTGRGSVQATPDVMRLNAGVEVRRPRAGEAFSAAKTAAGKLTAALLAAGVSRRNLRTNDLSLAAEYEKYPKVVGYRASQGVEALIRDLSVADAVVEAVAAAGEEARLSGISFEVSKGAALMRQARAAAYGDALAKARQYAALAGRRVGRVLKMEEEGETSPSRFAVAEQGTINPGQGTINVVVRVLYELA